MSPLTDDPRDPHLTHGPDDEPTTMADVYLVLSEAERAQGYVRPVRRTYIHVGPGGNEVDPNNPAKSGLVPPGCGVATTMGVAIAETYARDPGFYGGTWCVGCKMHRPVGEFGEFVWEDGSRVGT